jgi:hypothetical protein
MTITDARPLTRTGPERHCPSCGTPLCNGPVVVYCPSEGRAVMAADVDIEFHAPQMLSAPGAYDTRGADGRTPNITGSEASDANHSGTQPAQDPGHASAADAPRPRRGPGRLPQGTSGGGEHR